MNSQKKPASECLETTLVISTVHAPVEALNPYHSECWPCMIHHDDTQAIFFIPEEDTLEVMKDDSAYCAIMNRAGDLGCSKVIFDRDGYVCEEFETYEDHWGII